jgi:hypothetical protein
MEKSLMEKCKLHVPSEFAKHWPEKYNSMQMEWLEVAASAHFVRWEMQGKAVEWECA